MASSLPVEILLLVLSHIDDFLPYSLPLLRLTTLIRTLHYPDYWPLGPRPNTKYYDWHVVRDIVTCVAKDGLELDRWERRLNGGDPDMWFSLLLLGLKNVRFLDISYTSSPYLLRTIESIVRSVPDEDNGCAGPEQNTRKKVTALQHLESIRIRNEWPIQVGARAFAPFFLLPAMRVFNANRINGEPEPTSQSPEKLEEYDWNLYPYLTLRLPAGSSPVREIILNDSNCRYGFREFIFACASLERFEYQHDNKLTYFNFRPRAFYEPLTTRSRTLQVLRLNDIGVTKNLVKNERSVKGQETQETIESWFGSLVEFTALKELRMPLRDLLDLKGGRPLLELADILPRGLEVLCLAKVDRVDYDLVVANPRALLVGGFSSLRKVIVQLYQVELFAGETKVRYLPANFRVPQFAKEAIRGV
ncbi:uncharacterized protein BJX67DRAFT_379187 [Aspergillus lucknowensis]|uniref:Leucine-rich repeat domain-containing protein n=1 Tax=Aspergillus lucknowensis TaxID=176173 RepID=A0ABR4M205_9EURO